MAHSNNKDSSSIKEFERSNTEEFEESGSEEFEGNDSEEFEESSTEESEDDWDRWWYRYQLVYQHQRYRDHRYQRYRSQRFGEPFEFGKSGNKIIDDFIFKNEFKWIPYNKFKNIEYLNEGGFGTIYKAIWLNRNEEEVILKCHKDLNENLNEFLKEWEYHTSVLGSKDIIDFYGFTEDPNTSKFMVIMDYANKDLMKKCWNEDPLKRPSALKVKDVIDNWICRPYKVSEELKSNIMEFINAPIGHNNLATKSHPQTCYRSRLLDFTSKELNEILESEDSQNYHASCSSTGTTEDLDDCIIKDE